jgi:hypothetical protein
VLYYGFVAEWLFPLMCSIGNPYHETAKMIWIQCLGLRPPEEFDGRKNSPFVDQFFGSHVIQPNETLEHKIVYLAQCYIFIPSRRFPKCGVRCRCFWNSIRFSFPTVCGDRFNKKFPNGISLTHALLWKRLSSRYTIHKNKKI